MNIAILGSGSWGLGMAQILADKYQIKVWSRNKNQCAQINLANKSPKYFPDITLSKNITCTTVIEEIIINSQIIIISLPVQAIREILLQCNKYDCENKIFISPSKGIELKSEKFATEICQETLPESCKFGCISGPNFAKDLIQLLPCSTTIAADDKSTLEEISLMLQNTKMQTIKSNNMITTQSMGAYKNITAIGCGLVYHLGPNCLATAFNNFFLELEHFIKLNLQERNQEDSHYKQNMLSPAGIGDFFGSCSSTNSRNFQFGMNLNQKTIIDQNTLCEGKYTIQALEKKLDKLPLVKALYQIIYENKNAKEAIEKILTLQ